MSKNKHRQPQTPQKPEREKILEEMKPSENESFIARYGKYILMLFAFLLYANTLGHQYTQDDAIVIYDNMYTQKGLAGIPGLLTKDTFFGFFKKEGKDKLVSGGRYRPFTPIMFAIEYQIFGKKPFIGHLINALMYGLLGFYILQLLTMIFSIRTDYKKHFEFIIFACALLFIAHPIHTEAVANIKGRDEIMSMLGAVLATIYTLKYKEKQATSDAVFAFLFFFMALMSKENAITFLAVIPAIFVFFYNTSFGKAISNMMPIFGATLLFLICRTLVLGLDMGGTDIELMNNPFIKLVGNNYIPFSGGEKLATIIYTLGYYIKLLFLPHPLTSDYYPRQIGIMSFTDPMVLLSLVAYIGLIAMAIVMYKKDRVISFASLYFIATLSIVSNIVFPIGTNMSERFMFMPSLAFCLLVPHILYKIIKNGKTTFGIVAVIILLFSVKTFTRNQVWKDDFTLFTTDVETSNKSAKMLNAAGGALSTESAKEQDPIKKKQMLTKAIGYLNEAVKIHPNYANAYLIMGNSYFYLAEYDKSILAYEQTLKINPQFQDASYNLAVSLRDAGRKAGEKENNIQKAEQLLLRSLSINPKDTETLRLLGISYGLSGRHAQAIEYFSKITQLEPKNASAFMNLSSAYNYNGDPVNAQKYKAIALQLDPNLKK
jgi:protein O-mannosyl-transferase